jgi:hypothetical protein
MIIKIPQGRVTHEIKVSIDLLMNILDLLSTYGYL